MKKKYWLIVLFIMFSSFCSVKNVNASSRFKIEEDCGEMHLVKYTGNDKIVHVPNGIITIEGGAFKNNKYIKKIVLPKTVRTIYAFSFVNLKNLKKVKFSRNLKEIESGAFQKCPNIKSISIPKKCSYIGYGSFTGCENLKKISVKKGNKYFKVKDGALYSKDMKELFLYPRKRKGKKTFVVSKNVKRIYDDAFYKNSYISKLIIKGNVIDGADDGGACNEMKSLREVVFETKQTSEYLLRFENCKKLEKVVLAEGTKSIGYKQFAGCSNLTTINFPDSLEAIADNAFEGCDKLVLPEFDESKIRHIDY